MARNYIDNDVSFEKMTVSYTSEGRVLEAKYGEYFKLNGETVDTEYARYESAYVGGKVERESDVITYTFGGKTLTLNYKEGTREE